jgi:hypothetical protein
MPPTSATAPANGATAPSTVSSQLHVTWKACQPRDRPPVSPGGACRGFGVTTAFGPTRVRVSVAYEVS